MAEHALKGFLGSETSYAVSSAGIEALPQQIHPLIREHLQLRGHDLSAHVPRKLTRDLLDHTMLPVVMGFNHQAFIRETFNRDVRLFNEVCFQKSEPILDLHEALPEWRLDLLASRDYVLSVIEYIFAAMPAFMAALQCKERELRRSSK